MSRYLRYVLTLSIAAGIGFAGNALAQDYPNRLVRIVVGFGPGGSVDVLARLIGQKLSEAWGQNVIVDNRPGAGGTIGAGFVVKAPPDGYTLLVGDIGSNAVAASLYPELPYDPWKDFAHVTQLVNFPLVVVVPTGSPFKGLAELIEQARAKSGKIRYSSAGVGTSPHLFLEMMNAMAGVNTAALHYKGSVPALMGLLAGDAEYTTMSISTTRAQLESGKVRAIAVTSARPIPRLPGVPPVSAVLPGYEALTFHGLHAPSKTPRPLISKLNQDVLKVMQRADVKEKLDALGVDVATSSPEEFSAFIKKQIDLWTPVVRNANIRPDY